MNLFLPVREGAEVDVGTGSSRPVLRGVDAVLVVGRSVVLQDGVRVDSGVPAHRAGGGSPDEQVGLQATCAAPETKLPLA